MTQTESAFHPSSIRNRIGRVRPFFKAIYSFVFTFRSSLPLDTTTISA